MSGCICTGATSQPYWRSNVAGVWGKFRKIGTEDTVVGIVPIRSYQQIDGSAITSFAISKAYTYIANAVTASMALTLPAASADIDGIFITVVSNNTRVNTTWISAGATFIGAPTTLTAGVPVKFHYIHSSLQWWISA